MAKKKETSDKQKAVSKKKTDKPKTKKHLFQKGQSGNPGGRPKGPDMRKMLTEFMQEEVVDGKSKEKKKRLRILLEALFDQAIKGNASYMTHILERMFGKVVQPVDTEEINVYVRESEPKRVNNDSSA